MAMESDFPPTWLPDISSFGRGTCIFAQPSSKAFDKVLFGELPVVGVLEAYMWYLLDAVLISEPKSNPIFTVSFSKIS